MTAQRLLNNGSENNDFPCILYVENTWRLCLDFLLLQFVSLSGLTGTIPVGMEIMKPWVIWDQNIQERSAPILWAFKLQHSLVLLLKALDKCFKRKSNMHCALYILIFKQKHGNCRQKQGQLHSMRVCERLLYSKACLWVCDWKQVSLIKNLVTENEVMWLYCDLGSVKVESVVAHICKPYHKIVGIQGIEGHPQILHKTGLYSGGELQACFEVWRSLRLRIPWV